MVTAKQVADNVAVLLIARFAMIVTPFIMALGIAYMNLRFDQVNDHNTVVTERVRAAEDGIKLEQEGLTSLGTRLAIIESSRAEARASLEKSQGQIIDRLNKIDDKISAVQEDVASVKAEQRKQ